MIITTIAKGAFRLKLTLLPWSLALVGLFVFVLCFGFGFCPSSFSLFPFALALEGFLACASANERHSCAGALASGDNVGQVRGSPAPQERSPGAVEVSEAAPRSHPRPERCRRPASEARPNGRLPLQEHSLGHSAPLAGGPPKAQHANAWEAHAPAAAARCCAGALAPCRPAALAPGFVGQLGAATACGQTQGAACRR